jgi:hypothetical protein
MLSGLIESLLHVGTEGLRRGVLGAVDGLTELRRLCTGPRDAHEVLGATLPYGGPGDLLGGWLRITEGAQAINARSLAGVGWRPIEQDLFEFGVVAGGDVGLGAGRLEDPGEGGEGHFTSSSF